WKDISTRQEIVCFPKSRPEQDWRQEFCRRGKDFPSPSCAANARAIPLDRIERWHPLGRDAKACEDEQRHRAKEFVPGGPDGLGTGFRAAEPRETRPLVGLPSNPERRATPPNRSNPPSQLVRRTRCLRDCLSFADLENVRP